MGAGMSKNLLNAGYELTVWNRTESKTKPVVDSGPSWPRVLRRSRRIARW
jgi:3-hydroxyisobutyrate dehydrogenase-like beta-hydroxyacid dehydrogenase